MTLPGEPRLPGHGTLAGRPRLVGWPLSAGVQRTGTRNPISFLATGDGTTYRDRVGTGSLTASGAVRSVTTPLHRVVMRDDFERADGPLGTAPSGQVWQAQGGDYTALISSGRMVLPVGAVGQHAAYPMIDVGQAPSRMGGQFSFTGAAGDPDAVVLISSLGGAMFGTVAFANMVHLIVTMNGWSLNVFQDGVGSAEIAGSTHTITAGTVYSIAIDFDPANDQVTVWGPNGQRTIVTDARFAQVYGRYLIWEMYLDDATPTATPRWEAVEAAVPAGGGTTQALVIEEATTNGVKDPVFGNSDISIHWVGSPSGVVLTRDSSAALHGAGSSAALVTCDGSAAAQGIFYNSSQAPTAADGQTWVASFEVKAANPATIGKKVQIVFSVRNSSGGFLSESFSTITMRLDSTYNTLWAPYTINNPSAGRITARVVFVGTAAGAFHVGGVQLENKTYPTSVAAGSMGTGYAWTGTAHASTTTRSAANLSLSPVGSRVNPAQGTVVAMVRYENTRPSTGNTAFAHYAGPTDNDRIALTRNASGALTGQLGSSAAMTGSGFATVGTWTAQAMTWDGTSGRLYKDGLLIAGPTAYTGLDSVGTPTIEIGASTTPDNWLNGRIRAIAIFDRVLTTTELATLQNADPASWWTVVG